MSETLHIASGSKAERYQTLLPQIKSLIADEPDLIANLANISAAINATFSPLWVGFYLVKPTAATASPTLVLGPYQGPLACTRIALGKGVCGQAWEKRQTLVVPDVQRFPGHIACSSLSRSEIVVPLFRTDETVWGVLDMDSQDLNTFDHVDAHYLSQLSDLLMPWAPPMADSSGAAVF